MQYIVEKLRLSIDNLMKYMFVKQYNLENIEYQETGYKTNNIPPENNWEKFDTSTEISGANRHFWFHLKCRSPRAKADEKVCFTLNTGKEGNWAAENPQGILYINGRTVQGLDTNHYHALIEPDAELDIYCYFFTGMIEQKCFFIPKISIINKRIEKLYYDLKVAFDSANLPLPETEKCTIFNAVEKAINIINFREIYSERFFEEIDNAQKCITEEFYEKECAKSKQTVSCIGHTHIDVAWLWTYAQTKEKAQRSFSTVLELMKQYPEYKFMSSQPVLLEYLKEQSPELYDEVKERVKEGRWEIEGAMYLEADCNLTSGESLTRQILYGKRFMKKEFGIDSRILWLPDVFGYSAALPQILKKSGVDYFVTSKISWNDTNVFPHDTFYWEGIDGTELFTNFITTQSFAGYDFKRNDTTYIGTLTPAQILGTWARYHEKEYNRRTLTVFGWGDGGGGPTSEMLEYQRRLSKGIPGIPVTEMTTVRKHLEQVKESFDKKAEELSRYPKWVGELYLELHRGTYTSMAKNKRNNRKSEISLHNAEAISIINSVLNGREYPKEELDGLWKLVLLNQFHDVLPGSSIEEVYKDSDAHYEKVLTSCDKLIKDGLTDMFGGSQVKEPIAVNLSGAEADGTVKVNGETYEILNVPSYGYKKMSGNLITENSVIGNGEFIENDFYKIEFDEKGAITSLFDKRFNKETVKHGGKLNEFVIYEDEPRCYDNWEINEYYKLKYRNFDEVSKPVFITDGSRCGVKRTYRTEKSSLTQTVWLYSKLDRIDFETTAEWNEHHQLLRTLFPFNIHSAKATYEIQFGNLERATHSNTSWDEAKFEVCAQKWADVSDGGYGISLINDCKYGHSCSGSELGLTLIKCGTYPNKHADEGEHIFSYSLLPHGGDYRAANTVGKALNFNMPLMTVNGKISDGEYSFVSTDSKNVIIDTLKKAEDSNDLIVRLYESADISKKTVISFAAEPREVILCDLMENEISVIAHSGNRAELDVSNFEIITLKVKF